MRQPRLDRCTGPDRVLRGVGEVVWYGGKRVKRQPGSVKGDNRGRVYRYLMYSKGEATTLKLQECLLERLYGQERQTDSRVRTFYLPSMVLLGETAPRRAVKSTDGARQDREA